MSGINQIKAKAKLSLDEMFEHKPVGKLENPKTGKPAKQEKRKSFKNLAVDLDNHPVNQPSDYPENHISGQSANQVKRKQSNNISMGLDNQPSSKVASQQVGNVEIHKTIYPDSQLNGQISGLASQQSQKPPSYKMTFNLNEKSFTAFNDLYAQRMLKGRKTEKSDMICEAIDWLIKMEDEK